MRKLLMVLFAVLLLALPGTSAPAQAAPAAQAATCRFFSETGGYNVCDDGQARFLSAFDQWGLQQIGYPVSRRYTRDGFIHQAFQKAIMQWRAESGTVVLVNIFDDLHRDGVDQRLLDSRQTPFQFPAGWDGEGLTFEQVVAKRQALLNARPAMRARYFSVNDPLTFFGLPTSEIQDMGNHYAIRLQRAVLQEWKEDVPWARAGQVTIANGGDIAKELGGLPEEALLPEAGGTPPDPAPPAPAPPAPSTGDVVIIALDKDAEFADITNRGATPVDLAGWILRSEHGSQDCPLGGVLAPGDALRIWAKTGNGGFSCGFEGNVWNNSEYDPAVLIDPAGREVSRFH